MLKGLENDFTLRHCPPNSNYSLANRKSISEIKYGGKKIYNSRIFYWSRDLRSRENNHQNYGFEAYFCYFEEFKMTFQNFAMHICFFYDPGKWPRPPTKKMSPLPRKISLIFSQIVTIMSATFSILLVDNLYVDFEPKKCQKCLKPIRLPPRTPFSLGLGFGP